MERDYTFLLSLIVGLLIALISAIAAAGVAITNQLKHDHDYPQPVVVVATWK